MNADKEAGGLRVEMGREGSSGDAAGPEVTCILQALLGLEGGERS